MTTTATAPQDLARHLSRAGLHSLSISALQALCEIAAADSLTMTGLSRKLGVSTASITGTADVLERAALVTRQPSRIDRRIVSLILTAKGQSALSDILNA